MGGFGDLIKNFSPSYGACIMGTGILAITSKIYSAYLPILSTLSIIFTILNTLLALIITPLWVLRWIFYRKEALDDLTHPVKTNFYPTLPIGFMILGMDYIVVENNFTIGLFLWLVGAILTFAFGIIIPYNLFRSETVHLEHINPSIFIPPVGLIVIPIAGGVILTRLSGTIYDLVFFLNIVSWGSGFFIYLALLAVCVHRFLLHKPLPNVLAPTMWINLGPIGAGTVALYNLSTNTGLFNDEMLYSLKAFLVVFWGSGVWWLLLAIIMTIHYIDRQGLPYAPTWWAFTFPLGAYVAATHVIYMILGVKVFDYFGLAIYLLLLGLWLAAFQGALRGALNTIRKLI